MKKMKVIFVTIALLFTLAGCSSATIQCGAGTSYVDGQCVAADQVEDKTPTDNGSQDDDQNGNQNDDGGQNNNGGQDDDGNNNQTVENQAPVITLTGAVYTMYVNDTFTMPTCVVTDDVDTGLTCTSSGDTVDPNTVGTYLVVFTTTDNEGLTTTKDYNVSVIERPNTSNGSIRLKADKDLLFTIGEYFPMNLYEYFEADAGALTPGSVTHNVLMSADYLLFERGTYTVTVSIGGQSQDFVVTVVDPDMNPSDWVTGTEPGIYMNPNKQLVFNVNDYMPNWADYFIGFDGTNIMNIPVGNYQYTLLMDADQRMISEGFAEIEVTVGTFKETFIIVILGEGLDSSIFTEITEQGLYENFETKQFTFNTGERMPDFSSYYIGHDGDDFVVLHPGMTLHDIVLSDDNIFIQPGTYTVSIEVIINGQVYTDSFTVTVE